MRSILDGFKYGTLRVWCGFVGHDWREDRRERGVPVWCNRCNWWGGFTVMSPDSAAKGGR